MTGNRDEIWDLIENLKAHQRPEFREHRLGWALRLDDLLRHPGEVTFMTDTLQHLIDHVIPFENDRDVRGELFNAVEHSWSKNLSVDLALDEVMRYAREDDAPLTCNILLLIAKSGDRKYQPFVERHLGHANDFIRANAEYAWTHNYKDRD